MTIDSNCCYTVAVNTSMLVLALVRGALFNRQIEYSVSVVVQCRRDSFSDMFTKHFQVLFSLG